MSGVLQSDHFCVPPGLAPRLPNINAVMKVHCSQGLLSILRVRLQGCIYTVRAAKHDSGLAPSFP